MKFPKQFRWYFTFGLPLVIVIIYLKGYYDIFSKMGTAVLTGWMIFACLLLLFIFWCAFGRSRKLLKKG